MKLLALLPLPAIAAGLLGGCRDSSARTGDPPAEVFEAENRDQPVLLFLGDSLCAAHGLDPEQGFVARLDEHVRRREWPIEVVNAGRSGDTSRGGLARLDWLLKRSVSVLFLELGANDMLRGLPVEETENNLRAIVERVRARDPEVRVVLAGMRALPNMGPEYAAAFDALFPRVAEDLDLVLLPFLLEGVGGEPQLNQDDQIHPNATGHALVAETVWTVLEPVLEEWAVATAEEQS